MRKWFDTELGRSITAEGRRSPARSGARMYAAARESRLTTGWTSSNTSANSELHSSLAQLRNRSRALVRDAAYAKRARLMVVNNVIGSGIGMQAEVRTSRDELAERINDAIECAWWEWSKADSCHTGGTLHFADIERQAMGQVFEAGEVFLRKHFRRFGGSRVPYALELIEPERLADEFAVPGAVDAGARVVMGVEIDRFHRPVAYWIREHHPGETRYFAGDTSRVERVPATEIIHLKVTDRWPQTRGEPWLHAVARKLNDMDGYTEAEIVAARGAANYMATIESPDDMDSIAEEQSDGTYQFPLEPGIVERLRAGEKLNFVSPNRPNANLEAFLRYMLREVASGVPGATYESMSRDYSQSNYSSSRLAAIDSRDDWRALQGWFIRSFREVVHREWLQQAVFAGAIREIPVAQYAADTEKFSAVSFKPRGWSWVDPTKEVEAYDLAIKAGLTTRSDVIAQTAGGLDIEDIDKQRRRELDYAEKLELEYSTDPEAYMPNESAPASAAPAGTAVPQDEEDPGDSQADTGDATESDRVIRLRR